MHNPTDSQNDSQRVSDASNWRTLAFIPRIWWGALALMALLAGLWISYQSYRYFRVPDVLAGREIVEGALDLHSRYDETQSWFRGEPVYRMSAGAVYAPASYSMLKILFNVLEWKHVKVLWYLASLVATVLLSWQLCRYSFAEGRMEKAFIGLMPFAFYSVGAAIGNGQLVLLVLPSLLLALRLLLSSDSTPWRTGLGVALMTFSLVQPTISAPFFWLLLFRSPRFLRAFWVVVAYAVLTVVAIYYQIDSVPNPNRGVPALQIMEKWAVRAGGGARFGSTTGGYGTVHNLMGYVGLQRFNVQVSLAILFAFGLWVYRNRRADLWISLAVTAIVARIWVYHRWYDDALLLIPMIALFRLSRSTWRPMSVRALSSLLFILLWGFSLAPGFLYTVKDPSFFIAVQILTWLSTLVFLATLVRQERSLDPEPDPMSEPRAT